MVGKGGASFGARNCSPWRGWVWSTPDVIPVAHVAVLSYLFRILAGGVAGRANDTGHDLQPYRGRFRSANGHSVRNDPLECRAGRRRLGVTRFAGSPGAALPDLLVSTLRFRPPARSGCRGRPGPDADFLRSLDRAPFLRARAAGAPPSLSRRIPGFFRPEEAVGADIVIQLGPVVGGVADLVVRAFLRRREHQRWVASAWATPTRSSILRIEWRTRFCRDLNRRDYPASAGAFQSSVSFQVFEEFRLVILRDRRAADRRSFLSRSVAVRSAVGVPTHSHRVAG